MADSTVALRVQKRNVPAGGPKTVSAVVASGVTLYQGTYASQAVATGLAGIGGDDAGTLFLGLVQETVTGNASGTVSVTCEYGFEVLATGAAAAMAIANVGAAMFLADNQTLDDAAGMTNDVRAGVLTQRVTDTSGWVYLQTGVGAG